MEKALAHEQPPQQFCNEDDGRGMDVDAESGLGAVDIQRIEQVYRYATREAVTAKSSTD